MLHKKLQGTPSSSLTNLLWPRRGVLAALGMGLASMGHAQTPLPASQAAGKRNKQATPAKPPEEPKPEKRSLSIAVANPTSLAYLPLLVAQQRGYFAQQGLELEIIEHQSSARAMQAVGAGQADVVCAWLENALSPAGRALALQSYVLMGRAPMMALGVSSRASGSPKTLAQLSGRMLGVVALNSPTHTLALALMRRAGLSSRDVRILSVGSPASAAAALRSGQIDALMHMDPLMQQLEQRGEVHIVADLRSPQLCEQALGAVIPSSCLCAAPDFLQRFPGTAQASADALYQAMQWLAQASLRDVLRLFPDGWAGLDAQLLVASLAKLRTAYSSDGLCAPAHAQALWQTMQQADPALRLDSADPLRSHTNTYMLRSALRLKG